MRIKHTKKQLQILYTSHTDNPNTTTQIAQQLCQAEKHKEHIEYQLSRIQNGNCDSETGTEASCPWQQHWANSLSALPVIISELCESRRNTACCCDTYRACRIQTRETDSVKCSWLASVDTPRMLDSVHRSHQKTQCKQADSRLPSMSWALVAHMCIYK